ncbi:pirin family protein [soil metagenome]
MNTYSTDEYRPLSRVDTTAPPSPGFIGEGHTAVEVVTPTALVSSDPFVLLMDDRLDIAKRRQIGGAHPHAGLETVTLVLEGSLRDRDEGDLHAGDLVWMSAGRGIVHNEAVEAEGRSRVLQLWIALPSLGRELPPRFEIVRKQEALQLRAPGVSGWLYSGSSGELVSTTRNRVPTTLIDVTLDPGAEFLQSLPVTYRGFVYVLEGDVGIGESHVAAGQVGWFNPGSAERLSLQAGARGARLVLYAGLPIDEPLIQHGPFVAGSMQEVHEFHRRMRSGLFTPMSRLSATQSMMRM